MGYYVYIVKCIDGTYYTGKTIDIARRLRAHNGEITGGAKYTKGRGPVELIYIEKFKTLSEALKREYVIKNLSRIDKIKLINKKVLL